MTGRAAQVDGEARQRGTRRLLALVGVVIVGVLLAANAHLVYAAFSSQPDCVSHLKAAGEPGTFRAAKSSC